MQSKPDPLPERAKWQIGDFQDTGGNYAWAVFTKNQAWMIHGKADAERLANYLNNLEAGRDRYRAIVEEVRLRQPTLLNWIERKQAALEGRPE